MARHILGCLNVIADSLSAHHNGVKSPPRSSESNIQTVGSPVVDMFATVHSTHLPRFMSPVVEQQALGRCSVTRLARTVDAHVSPAHSEAQDDPGGQGDTHSLLVTITTVVSTHTTFVCGPTFTTGICLKRQVVALACIEALMQHYQAAGFSREISKLSAAPIRLSTNRMYDNRWPCFAKWATVQGFDPLGPKAAQIAAFLYDVIDTHGQSPQTIKGHRHGSSSPG